MSSNFNCSYIHPSVALQQYREYTKNPEVRLIVVGMVSNGFSIADPKDPLMMDVIGFDTEAPKAMANFNMTTRYFHNVFMERCLC